MNKDILVLGKGWLGTRLAKQLDCNISSKRINTYEDIQEEIDKLKPKVLINCIGSVGKNNVDDCEKSKTPTLISNTLIPLLLCEAAIRNKCKLVHVSTSYLFNYDQEKGRPITEDTSPDFYDLYYSRTKEYAESALLAIGDACNLLIVRPAMILDYIPHHRNLLNKLITYKSVTDVENSVTYMPDFIEAVKHLIKIDATGVFNTVNFGGLRHRELLEAFREFYPNHAYAIASQNELRIVRPNLLLSTDKLEEAGFEVKDIHDVLKDCVAKYVAIVKGANEGQVEQVKGQESRVIYDQPKKK